MIYNNMIDDPNKLFTILSVSKLTSRLRSKITIPNKYLVSFTKVINFKGKSLHKNMNTSEGNSSSAALIMDYST